MKIWIVTSFVFVTFFVLTFGLLFSLGQIRKQSSLMYKQGWKDGEYFGSRNLYFACKNHRINDYKEYEDTK